MAQEPSCPLPQPHMPWVPSYGDLPEGPGSSVVLAFYYWSFVISFHVGRRPPCPSGQQHPNLSLVIGAFLPTLAPNPLLMNSCGPAQWAQRASLVEASRQRMLPEQQGPGLWGGGWRCSCSHSVLVLRAPAGFPTPQGLSPSPPRPTPGPPGPPTGQLLRGRAVVRLVGAVGRAPSGCSIGPEAQMVVLGEAWRAGQAEPIPARLHVR